MLSFGQLCVCCNVKGGAAALLFLKSPKHSLIVWNSASLGVLSALVALHGDDNAVLNVPSV